VSLGLASEKAQQVIVIPKLKRDERDFLANPVIQSDNAVLVISKIVVAWKCPAGHIQVLL
jgi:hypothetical protein